MPKKILYESAIHQFLWAAKCLRLRVQAANPRHAEMLASWVAALEFENAGSGTMLIRWSAPAAGVHKLQLKGTSFYTRGDTPVHSERQAAANLPFHDDQVMAANHEFFDEAFQTILTASSLFETGSIAVMLPPPVTDSARDRKEAEESFHDEWAAGEDIATINVRQRNTACTAPEMRHIRTALGDLNGRHLLDVGCGLGEASVYFALEGATVTATDISPGMCDITQRLAAANGVKLTTHVSAIEDLGLGDQQFDIIYSGNTLHHADISAMLDKLLLHLKPTGVFVSWDPVAYNPVINIYRALATEVRTKDEHPLRLSDVRMITRRFASHEVRWFWLTTLFVFICMAVFQFRNPNKERFWKKVVDEADHWQPIYSPLEKLDAILLRIFPFLRPLCWNVAIVAHGPLSVPLLR